MADINIERKRASVWPWIVGLVVLGLLIWALTQLFDRGDVEQLEQPVTSSIQPTGVPTLTHRAA